MPRSPESSPAQRSAISQELRNGRDQIGKNDNNIRNILRFLSKFPKILRFLSDTRPTGSIGVCSELGVWTVKKFHTDMEGVTLKIKFFGGLLVAVGCALALQPAGAATATLSGTGTSNDGALGASAAFTTSTGLLTVTLSNTLAANVIRSAGQAVSDLSFTLSNAPGTLGTTSATGTFATFNGSTTPTLAAGNPIRWLGADGQGSFSIIGNTITLEAIGGGQPSQLILPTGTTYSNANASITGGQFSPFLDGPITFTLALSGVTANTTITSATFSFGTGPDTLISVVPGGTPVVTAVPLPGTLPLFATGLLGLWALRRKRKAAAGKSLPAVTLAAAS